MSTASRRSTSGAPSERARGSLVAGGATMLVLVVLLSWLPVLGPLIAGGAGGWIIREGRAAVLVALVPAVVLAGFMVLVLGLFDLPVLGVVAGAAVFLAVAIQEIPLLIGAYAGGTLRD